MQVRLFGELQAVHAGVPVPVRGVKQRTLLAVLALARGAPVSADRLIDVLWGERRVSNPANALQAQVGQLRRALGSAAIITTGAGYALNIGPEDVDVGRFAQLVSDGRRLAAEGETARASTALSDALQLRRGPPLAEFAYGDFAEAERAQIDELTLAAVEARAATDLLLGRHGDLIGELEAWCRQHPLRERLWELLILALYRAGRQGDALRTYTEVRDRLIDELGIDPGPALRELEARILAQDPALTLTGPAPVPPAEAVPPATAAAVPPATPSAQAVPPATAAAAERDAAPVVAGNLRPRLGRFVGREAELEQLREAICGSRLVTLIGPGGAGKTRLAVETAASLRNEHPDGAWLVELAGLTDPDGVAPAAAGALGAVAAPLRSPRPAGSTVELIVGHLAGRSLLVVLDNCEHVIDQAAAMAETLVAAVPGLRLIATSREPLGVPGEVLLPVGGLAARAAVELFIDRARAVRPGFTVDDQSRPVVEDICARLDGLPLAIELAAARLRALTLTTVAERLDDRFRLLTGGARTALPRQQTLRAVVDWSYDLLFEDERRLFARLSVFAGGCELAAAEAVCADDQVPTDEILDVLARLVDKSLVTIDVVPAAARYSQLQTLWQYAREHLHDSGEAEEFRGRHARWYLSMAERARFGIQGPSGVQWRARLEGELDNLRAALDWYIEGGDAASALALVGGIGYLWFLRSDFPEGYRWLGDALALDTTGSEAPRGFVAVWRAYFGLAVLGPAAALDGVRQAVADLRQTGTPELLAGGLLVLADLLTRHGELDASQAALAEAHPLLLAAGEAWNIGAHDIFAARNLAALGRADEAERMTRAGVAVLRSCGEQWVILYGLGMLAGLQESRGNLTGAVAAYEELLDACRSAKMIHFESMWLIRLAALRARLGDDITAEQLFADSIAANPRTANPAALVGRAAAARRLGDLAACRRWLGEAEAVYDSIGLPAGSTAAFIGRAWCSLAAGDLAGAAEYAQRARERAAHAADALVAVLADTAAAAVALAAADTEANRAAFAAALQRRATAGRSAAFLESYLDEPDVEAMAATHGLSPAGLSITSVRRQATRAP